MLPEQVYDYVYAGRQQIAVALNDVKGYVKQVQEVIEKFTEAYGVWCFCLYSRNFSIFLVNFLNLSELV